MTSCHLAQVIFGDASPFVVLIEVSSKTTQPFCCYFSGAVPVPVQSHAESHRDAGRRGNPPVIGQQRDHRGGNGQHSREPGVSGVTGQKNHRELYTKEHLVLHPCPPRPPHNRTPADPGWVVCRAQTVSSGVFFAGFGLFFCNVCLFVFLTLFF